MLEQLGPESLDKLLKARQEILASRDHQCHPQLPVKSSANMTQVEEVTEEESDDNVEEDLSLDELYEAMMSEDMDTYCWRV